MCKKPVAGEYWQWAGRVVCATCRGTLGALGLRAQSIETFLRAASLGALTALGCGIAYAVFVGLTHIQFALVTIGIAYLVATVIRRATGNVSGRRYQVLAVILTYCAGVMGYAPNIFGGITASQVPFAIAVMLAAPFLELTHAPLGILIIGFGLYEAWRRATPLPMEVTGPYRVPSASGGSPSASP
jgi:hypothetical protein